MQSNTCLSCEVAEPRELLNADKSHINFANTLKRLIKLLSDEGRASHRCPVYYHAMITMIKWERGSKIQIMTPLGIKLKDIYM